MIDGTIVVDTVAVIVLGGDRTAWSLLAASAFVSISGNGIHAWLTQGPWISVGIALTPPVFLLWVAHLTVRLGHRYEDEPKAQSDESPIVEADPRAPVLDLLAEGGLSMREIARRVGTNDRTVRRWRDAARQDRPASNIAA